MQGKDGIFIPMELVNAYLNAVFLIAVFFVAGCAVYYLWRGLRKIMAWHRMSQLERAKAFLRKHDPEFRSQEQMQGLVRRMRRPRRQTDELLHLPNPQGIAVQPTPGKKA